MHPILRKLTEKGAPFKTEERSSIICPSAFQQHLDDPTRRQGSVLLAQQFSPSADDNSRSIGTAHVSKFFVHLQVLGSFFSSVDISAAACVLAVAGVTARSDEFTVTCSKLLKFFALAGSLNRTKRVRQWCTHVRTVCDVFRGPLVSFRCRLDLSILCISFVCVSIFTGCYSIVSPPTRALRLHHP